MRTDLNVFKKPISPKNFALAIFVLLVLVFSFHTTVWHLATKNILAPQPSLHIGDLARLSYSLTSVHHKVDSNITLPKQHIKAHKWKGQKVDILTIGDSFSNGTAGGNNPFYQDYIASMTNTKVLNISTKRDLIESVISLSNNGLLSKMSPKVIILESVERYVIDRFDIDINWDANYSKNDFLSDLSKTEKKPQAASIINNGNYKYLINPLKYEYSSKPINISNVYKVPLSQELFSVEDPSHLLFYSEELDKILKATPQAIKKANKNLNDLAVFLQQKGVRLVFLPIVDKSNLYASYIVSNPFVQSALFEQLRPLPKQYYFVDTKAILQKALPKQLDLYYADDTHWSYHGSKITMQSIPFKELLKTTNER